MDCVLCSLCRTRCIQLLDFLYETDTCWQKIIVQKRYASRACHLSSPPKDPNFSSKKTLPTFRPLIIGANATPWRSPKRALRHLPSSHLRPPSSRPLQSSQLRRCRARNSRRGRSGPGPSEGRPQSPPYVPSRSVIRFLFLILSTEKASIQLLFREFSFIQIRCIRICLVQ